MSSYNATTSTTAAAGTAAQGGAQGSAPTGDTVNPEVLVYNIDIFVLAIMALFVLLRLPRALALLGSPLDWTRGHILRSVPYRQPARIVRAHHKTYPPPPPSRHGGASSDDAHTLYSYSHANHVQRIDEKGAPAKMLYPPHISSCPRILRGILRPLRARVGPGFSVAQTVIAALYFYILLYAGLYKSSPFTDSTRTGWLAISQIPFVFGFAAKNNVLGSLLGFGYERLNFIHRFAGRLVVLSANIHSLYWIYKWSMAGTFMAHIATPSSMWGLIGLICIDVLFFFSTAYWRQKAYNLFLCSHIAGFSLILPAAYLHKPSTLPYIYATVGIFAFDHLVRMIKTRITTAVIRPIPELELTHVSVPYINSGWRAGQHVRVRVFSSGMGLFGWAEVHPFTIASVTEGPEGMVLMCKKVGSWTRKLYEIAKASGYVDGGVGREVKMIIEGPYGGPGHTIFASFSAAVFIAGGSGITFALSAIQDLVQKDLKGMSRVKVIELVWVVQDPAALSPVLPLLSSIIQQSVFTPIRISVYYTRAPIGKFPFAEDFSIPGITLAPGRPRIAKVLDSALCRAVSLGAGVKDSVGISGMVVGVCGPVSLGTDVARAVGTVEPLRRDQVGGIEIHEETFGW